MSETPADFNEYINASISSRASQQLLFISGYLIFQALSAMLEISTSSRYCRPLPSVPASLLHTA